MGRIIALSNQKGGVGKSTLAMNLSAALATSKKVLLIDFDPQGNTSLVMLGNIIDDIPGMSNVLLGNTPLESVIRPTNTPNLDIAPANMDLSQAEIVLFQELGRENILRRKLTPETCKKYDYIIIDTQPSLGLLTINAFTTAEYVLIPVEAKYLALRGVEHLMKSIALAQEKLSSPIKVLGFVVNMYDPRLSMSREALGVMKEQFPTLVFDTVIRTNSQLDKAQAAHKTVFEYDPACFGAKDHLALANELNRKAA